MSKRIIRRSAAAVASFAALAVCASLLTVPPVEAADSTNDFPKVKPIKSAPVSTVHAKGAGKKSLGDALKFSPSKLPKRGGKVESELGSDWTDPAGGLSVRSKNAEDKDLGIGVTPLGPTAQTNAAGVGPAFEISAVTPEPSATDTPDAQPQSPAATEEANKTLSESPSTPTPTEVTPPPDSEDTSPGDPPNLAAPLEVKIDYSDFAGSFGGDWAGRLHLVKLDDCETTKDGLDCSKAEPLKTQRDAKAKTLTTSIPADEMQRSFMLAATAGASSGQGDYTATPMAPSSSWSAGNQSGDFNWSYPMGAPPGLGGPMPDLQISYSSGTVDGKSSATNDQTSWIGEGFSFDPGFVERSYEPCRQVKEGDATSSAPTDVGDMCWRDDNLTMSLGGSSSQLVRVGTTNEWRMKNDDGTSVERVAGGTNDDNDGEHWVVTTADGTKYYYGLNERFTGDTHKTNSVSTVPVYGSRTGEPCHGASFAASVCDQGWRWGLDYVVDTHGNTMSLFYDQEKNHYGSNKNATVREYDRAATLTSIEYGTRKGTENDSPAPMKVDFTTAERCISDGFDCSVTMTAANASHWPEVPFDQICTSTTTCPGRISPSFFSRKRLATVATFVADGSEYDPINEWKLSQELPAIEQEAAVRTLVLTQIQQTGKDGTDIELPPVTFTHTQMDNRVYDSSGINAFRRYRLTAINNGTGGSIAVVYSQPDCTSSSQPPVTALDTNARRCYPVWYQPDWSTERQIEFFHKYRVDSVSESDNTGGAVGKITSYTYSGGDGWHYSDSNLERPKYRTWSEWRGYQSVTTEVGLTNKTYSNTLYMRGMNGNKKQAGGTWTVNVTDPESGGATSLQDDDQLAGFERRTVSKLGSSGAVVNMSINTPWVSAATATQGSKNAYIVDVAQSDVKTWLPASSTYRTTRSTTSYDTRGQIESVLDAGDIAITTDDQCTKTTYATNSADGMYDFPATEITIAGTTCAATPASAADVISATRTSYDGGAVGDAPTKGDGTKLESASGWTSGGGITYQTDSTTDYDVYGRVVSAKDANSEETTTAYSPASGPLETVTETNPLNQTTVTAINHVGGPTSQTDVAGAKTEYEYDSLGRVTSIWGPERDRDNGDSASTKFTYRVSTTQANAVTTETLNNVGNYVSEVAFYDGFLRERSTQSPSPGSTGGRQITDKRYDDHGWLTSDRGPYFNSSPVDTNLVTAAENVINSYTNFGYDGAGRVTTESLASYGAVKFSTTTSYGGDRVSSTPPTGGTASTTVSDARGQVTSLLQYLGTTPSGTADTTTYGYTKRGELAKITDSSGTIWNKTYDIRGRLITDADPDKGTTTYTYDALDQQITSTDARAFTLWNKYDKLGRKTELRDDNATGTLRSAWVYDTVRPGALTSSTRYDGANTYVNEVTAYDPTGQPTSSRVVIPAAEGLLAGSYVTDAEYNIDGSVKKLTQPAIDDPTAEELTYTYDALGNPKKLTGFTTLVTGTTYSSLGQLMQRSLGTTSGKGVADTRDYDLATNRTIAREVGLQGSATMPKMDLRYTYDDSGNVIKLNDVAAGDTAQTSASSWRQCFKYDYLRRMTSAYTSSGNTCATPTTANLGTLTPYWDAYTFAKSGNRAKVVSVRKPAASLVTTTHTSTFPAATSARPHAVSSTAKTGGSTGTESFVYDAAGNLSKRSTSATAGKNIVFDREGREKTVTDIATGKVTTYLYDADGNRLIQRDTSDSSSTLFLASGEVTSKAGVRTTVRTYTMGGEAVATRDATSVKLMVADNNGTPLISVDGVTQAFEKRRYSPYGESLQAPVSWPSTRGYLNKTTDKTGTTHLGAREYDPAGSRFISVDPVMDPMDPQQMNGYAYANNSPVTSSDPTGLFVPCEGQRCAQAGGGGLYQPKRAAWNKQANTNYKEYKKKVYNAGVKEMHASKPKAKPKKDKGGGGVLGKIWGGVKTVGHVANEGFKMGVFDYTQCFGGNANVGGCIIEGAGFIPGGKVIKGLKVGANLVGGAKHGEQALEAASKLCSFSGATVVLMADGSKIPIKDVNVGDMVAATDPKTGEQQPKAVDQLFVHEDTLSDLIVDGEAITTTEDHPFWSVTDQRFERADQLSAGEQVLGADGRKLNVSSTKLSRTHLGMAYNLSVEDVHTYHVGRDAILVHNNSTCKREIKVVTRSDPGSDGGTSRHLIEKLDGETVSVTHQVDVGGEIVHQHQRYVGKYGSQRYFPEEWSQFPYIGY